MLYGDLRCVDNAAITGKQRLFATIGSEVISEATNYSPPYNFDGTVNISNSDNENKNNWRTLSVEFTLAADDKVTIGYDCPQDEAPKLGRIAHFAGYF